MEQVVFSVNDETLRIGNNNINLYIDGKDKIILPIASTDKSKIELPLYILPQSILYPTDEELAKSALFNIEKLSTLCVDESEENIFEVGFINGRKSFGEDKKYHLSEDELKELINTVRIESIKSIVSVTTHKDNSFFIASITSQPIYPHTITVDYEEGNYIWETLKAEYE